MLPRLWTYLHTNDISRIFKKKLSRAFFLDMSQLIRHHLDLRYSISLFLKYLGFILLSTIKVLKIKLIKVLVHFLYFYVQKVQENCYYSIGDSLGVTYEGLLYFGSSYRYLGWFQGGFRSKIWLKVLNFFNSLISKNMNWTFPLVSYQKTLVLLKSISNVFLIFSPFLLQLLKIRNCWKENENRSEVTVL